MNNLELRAMHNKWMQRDMERKVGKIFVDLVIDGTGRMQKMYYNSRTKRYEYGPVNNSGDLNLKKNY